MKHLFFALACLGSFCVMGCRSAPKIVPPVEEVVQVYDDKTLEEVSTLAAEGDIPAMMTLAYRYEQGIGTSQNHHKAAEWYLHAARRRDLEATYRLALIYANPESPLYNFKSAKLWLRRAKRMGTRTGRCSILRLSPAPITDGFASTVNPRRKRPRIPPKARSTPHTHFYC